MSDQNFHEIQLSGKQLVFLFMCAVVLTVVVFLFGVSVGRGVRSPSVQAASASPASTPTDTIVPADTPPPTQTAPNELSYAQALQGQGGDPSKVTPPAPASEEPPASSKARKSEPPPTVHKSEQASAPAHTAPPPVAAPPAAAPKTPPPQDVATKPVPATNGFFVQVAAYSANDVAAKEVAKLRNKGYPALVFAEPENAPGPRFKVRVGPYSAHVEADQALKSLKKEGYSPLIKR